MNVVTDDQPHCSVSGVLFGSSMEQILKQMSLSKLSYFGGVCVCSRGWGGGGGGGGQVLNVWNVWNTSELVLQGWWVPFTVIELVPRVVILQIIGQ